MASERNDKPNVYYNPKNFDTTGKWFNGYFKIKNTIEGLVVALPLVFIISRFNLPDNVKITVMLLVFVAVVMLFINGIGDQSIGEVASAALSFMKNKRIAKYNPRIKTESEPDYLAKESVVWYKFLLSLFTGKKDVDEANSIDKDISDPEYIEFFRDDLDVVDLPDQLKTKSQLNKERRERNRVIAQKKREIRRRRKETRKAQKRRNKR